MRNTQSKFVGLLAILAIVCAAEKSLARSLDLLNAIEVALENSPSYKSARLSVDLAQKEVLNARAAYFPSLDFSAEQGVEQDPLDDSSTSRADLFSSLNLGLTEQLYDNGRQQIRSNLAALKYKTAELEFRRIKEEIVLRISGAYLDYSLAVRTLDAEREQAKLLETQVRTTSSRYRQGLTRETDFLLIQAQQRRADVAVLAAEQKLKTTRLDLIEILGIPKDLIESDAIQLIVLPLDAVNVSVPSKPVYESTWPYLEADLAIQISDAEVDLVKAESGLRIEATAGGEYVLQNYLRDSSTPAVEDGFGWKALLVLKANLWDWGTRRRNVEIATGEKRITEYRYQTEQLAVLSELEQLMLEVRIGNELLKAARDLLHIQNRATQMVQNDYRVGRTKYLDLVTSVSDLTRAQIGVAAQSSSLLRSIYRFRYLHGDLYESLRH
ncbi:MAG TPA: TolC family protein [Bdellovibrionales bacterium]|nr:TolC family protein [Bdellovibrionales bacterium]